MPMGRWRYTMDLGKFTVYSMQKGMRRFSVLETV
nr:MAG TPA: hypothetical protein [Caudoviricetes sp.]